MQRRTVGYVADGATEAAPTNGRSSHGRGQPKRSFSERRRFAVVAALVRNSAIGYHQRRDALARAGLFASLAGVIASLVHGVVDFSLQIPSNAAWFMALLGLGVVAATVERGGAGAPPPVAPPHPLRHGGVS